MTSPIDSKVVPFGQAVDTLQKFIQDEGEVLAGEGYIPTLRSLVGVIREASAARDEILNEYLGQIVSAANLPLDLGQVTDPIVYNRIDLGTI